MSYEYLHGCYGCNYPGQCASQNGRSRTLPDVAPVSILASELGRHQEAFDFFHFATRIDLDNYNRNTHEGIHTTSIAAAWINIVYGFGGMRSDGDVLSFKPSIPTHWNGYSFQVAYCGSVIRVEVLQGKAILRLIDGEPISVKVCGQVMEINREG